MQGVLVRFPRSLLRGVCDIILTYSTTSDLQKPLNVVSAVVYIRRPLLSVEAVHKEGTLRFLIKLLLLEVCEGPTRDKELSVQLV